MYKSNKNEAKNQIRKESWEEMSLESLEMVQGGILLVQLPDGSTVPANQVNGEAGGVDLDAIPDNTVVFT